MGDLAELLVGALIHPRTNVGNWKMKPANKNSFISYTIKKLTKERKLLLS